MLATMMKSVNVCQADFEKYVVRRNVAVTCYTAELLCQDVADKRKNLKKWSDWSTQRNAFSILFIEVFERMIS